MAVDDNREAVSNAPTAVVGIGASAGGLEALEAVFGSAPDESGFAYVVVTHLSPNFKSLMDELLSQHTTMPVQQVEDGMTIQANQVYVIPPNTEMIVVSGQLLLSDRAPGNQIALPIDTFFHSMAREYGNKAIGIILSGTGGDGSHALAAIRDAGGRVIVQDPDSAKFDGMPRAAMATGMADLQLTPSKIGEALYTMDPANAHRNAIKPISDDDPEHDDLVRIFAALFGTSSINFEAYKTTTVLRRINRRMVARKTPSMAAYAQLLEDDAEEAANLNRDMLIGVTRFFRDTESFEQLDELVITELAKNAGPDRPIRIWVPGCATGEEAYSIAMLLQRKMDELGVQAEAQIFATDLQRDFVETAGRGLFSPETFPSEWDTLREAYTRPTDDGMLQIEPHIRRLVVFAHHNVLSDPPFTRLDLVSCRNMLIYLQPEAQEQVLSLIAFGLRRSGFLFLGPSETLGSGENSFTVLDKRWRIFRKEREVSAFQVPERRKPEETRTGSASRPRSTMGLRRPTRQRREVDLLPAYGQMLDRFAPPSVLIDGERQLQHVFGSAREHLRPPAGLTSLDVLEMVPDWLRLPMATAIERVNREGNEVRYTGESPDGIGYDFSVMPLSVTPEGRRGFKLVLLDQKGPVRDTVDVEKMVRVLDNDTVTTARIQDLEGELRHTKENLQATIEEVETSNEELQSTNEELMAANEELQSTNEELHSVNEELYSVNAEYQRKNDELLQLNRDMEALMASTDVGVIFVDDRLAIRRFTSPAKRIFNLIDEDQGRSLTHLTHTLVDADIVAIARRAVDQFLSSEQRFQSEDGAWWLLRCMPMKTPGSNAIGAIISAVDIDEVQKKQMLLEKDRWREGLIFDHGGSFVVTSDADLRIVEPVESWERFTGQSFKEYQGDGWLKAVHPDDLNRLRAAGRPEAQDENGYQTSYRLWHAKTQRYRFCQVNVIPEFNEEGDCEAWTGIVVDIDDAVTAQDTLTENEKLITQVTQDMPGMLCLLNTERRYIFVNQGYQDRWAGDRTILGDRIDDVLPPDIIRSIEPHLEAAFRGVPQEFIVERNYEGHDREVLLVIYSPSADDSGTVTGISVCILNITESMQDDADQRSVWEQFGTALMRSSGEYLIVDPETLDICYASDGAVHNLRRAAADMPRTHLYDLLPEYDQARLQGELDSHDDRSPLQMNTFVLRGDGTTYDARISLQRHTDINGQLIATITNVSEASAARKALRRRNEELARSNSDLENFAYFASHDLQEPARKIGNFAGLVEEDLGEEANEETREYLEIIRRASDRMLTLVQDLLTFSRVRAVEEQFVEVDTNKLLQEIAADNAPELKSIGGTLKIGKMPRLQGDSMLLNQMFSNLVSNAIKYRDQETPLKISIRSKIIDDNHQITVTDNGIGFDDSDTEIIFGLFQRLHSPSGIPGSGVGLAICKRVAELHGGDITAESEPGKGASFTVTLPVRPSN